MDWGDSRKCRGHPSSCATGRGSPGARAGALRRPKGKVQQAPRGRMIPNHTQQHTQYPDPGGRQTVCGRPKRTARWVEPSLGNGWLREPLGRQWYPGAISRRPLTQDGGQPIEMVGGWKDSDGFGCGKPLIEHPPPLHKPLEGLALERAWAQTVGAEG